MAPHRAPRPPLLQRAAHLASVLEPVGPGPAHVARPTQKRCDPTVPDGLHAIPTSHNPSAEHSTAPRLHLPARARQPSTVRDHGPARRRRRRGHARQRPGRAQIDGDDDNVDRREQQAQAPVGPQGLCLGRRLVVGHARRARVSAPPEQGVQCDGGRCRRQLAARQDAQRRGRDDRASQHARRRQHSAGALIVGRTNADSRARVCAGHGDPLQQHSRAVDLLDQVDCAVVVDWRRRCRVDPGRRLCAGWRGYQQRRRRHPHDHRGRQTEVPSSEPFKGGGGASRARGARHAARRHLARRVPRAALLFAAKRDPEPRHRAVRVRGRPFCAARPDRRRSRDDRSSPSRGAGRRRRFDSGRVPGPRDAAHRHGAHVRPDARHGGQCRARRAAAVCQRVHVGHEGVLAADAARCVPVGHGDWSLAAV